MKKNHFQPTFDNVIRLAGVTDEDFGHAVIDLAVEFAESYLGKGERFALARQALYATPEFWVWFKRILANASLAWVEMAQDNLQLRIQEELWQYWQTLMRIHMNLHSPVDYVVEAYVRKLETV